MLAEGLEKLAPGMVNSPFMPLGVESNSKK